MKIGFIHERFPIGGAEKVTSDIGNYLFAKGYELYVFAYQINHDALSEQDKRSFTFVNIDKKDLYSISTQNALILEANQLNLDILIHVGGGLKIVRNHIINQTSCKHIYAHHGTPFWEIRDELQRLERKSKLRKLFLSRWKYKYFKIPWFNKFGKNKINQIYQDIYTSYDAVTVLCDPYKQQIIDKLHLSSADKLVVMPNGLPHAPFDYSLKKKKQILYLGRMSYADKRIDRLIKIWKNIYKDFPDWEFVVVGDGDEKQNLEQLVNQYKLERIRFTGSTTTPHIYYNDASILCMSSQFEGTPLVITEAQQAGVIPIAFNCSDGVQSLMYPSKKHGVLVEDFDMGEYEKELRELMINTSLRKTMQKSCIEKSKTYSMQVIGKKWEDLFLKLTNTVK